MAQSGRYSVDVDDERRARPWTRTDYERLRQAVLAMSRTHTSIDRPGGRILSAFDGRLYWKVLGALDRTHEHQDGTEEDDDQ